MAVIPIYHQGELANPTVGVPQMNQSGEIAGQAALEGQQGIAEAQLGQNRQDIVEANSGMDAGVRAFGGVYKDIQWVQAQLRGQQNAAEKHSQDIQDAIQSNALGNQMKADLSDKMLALKMAGKDNPDALPGQWDDGLEGYVDKFAESHPMNDAVRGNLEKDFANIKAHALFGINAPSICLPKWRYDRISAIFFDGDKSQACLTASQKCLIKSKSKSSG